MGDLFTHEAFSADIEKYLIRNLRVSPESARCVSVGNWLRDMSQFRDPYSLQMRKLATLREQRDATKGLKANVASVGLPLILGSLLGNGRKAKPGALEDWFKATLKAAGLVTFCVPSVQAAGDELEDAGTPRVALSVKVFDELFSHESLGFTEYYPHEHLDLPPLEWGPRDALLAPGQVRVSPDAGAPTRQVATYLEQYIDYIGEQLAAVETELRSGLAPRSATEVGAVKQADANAADQSTREALLRFGRASHAIEDFFYHSNFVEISELHRVTRYWPEQLGMETMRHSAALSALPLSERRVWYRRLRSVSVGATVPSRCVVTGGFGENDLGHTLADAFSTMGNRPRVTAFLLGLDSHLMSCILDSSKRRSLLKKNSVEVDDAAIVLANKKHVKEVSTLRSRAASKKPWGAASKEVEEAILSAIEQAAKIEEDVGNNKLHNYKQALSVEQSWKIGQVAGTMGGATVGYILLNLAARTEAAEEASNLRRLLFDVAVTYDSFNAEKNGSTYEDIGSHTLMSKDSPKKMPLRDQTKRLAIFTVRQVTRVMVARALGQEGASVTPNRKGEKAPPTAQMGFDWAGYLRTMLCHPQQAVDNWPERVLAGEMPDISIKPYLRPVNTGGTRAGFPLTLELQEKQRRLDASAEIAELLKSWSQDVNPNK